MKRHKWTKEEDEWLKINYTSLGPTLCYEFLGLTRKYDKYQKIKEG